MPLKKNEMKFKNVFTCIEEVYSNHYMTTIKNSQSRDSNLCLLSTQSVSLQKRWNIENELYGPTIGGEFVWFIWPIVFLFSKKTISYNANHTNSPPIQQCKIVVFSHEIVLYGPVLSFMQACFLSYFVRIMWLWTIILYVKELQEDSSKFFLECSKEKK